jgi:hypothetical protein
LSRNDFISAVCTSRAFSSVAQVSLSIKN